MKNIPLSIVYDNWCPNCKKFVTLVKRLDWFKLIVPVPLRNLEMPHFPDGLDMDKARRYMASYHKNWQYGFETIYRIAKRLPIVWLFLPFLYLVKISGAGSYFYKELSARRKIVCTDTCNLRA